MKLILAFSLFVHASATILIESHPYPTPLIFESLLITAALVVLYGQCRVSCMIEDGHRVQRDGQIR